MSALPETALGSQGQGEGLSYTMATQALMPDERLVEWVPLQTATPR